MNSNRDMITVLPAWKETEEYNKTVPGKMNRW
jgi:hypothetical protein